MMLHGNAEQSVFIPLEVNKETLRTYIAIVLDKSGSMEKIKDATIDGFNKQVDSIVREAVGKVYLSLITFSSQVEPVFVNQPPSYLTKLTRENYRPNGWTALYDAVGHAINRLEYTAEDVWNSAFLVIIVSDGVENFSKEFKFTLPAMIKRKQETGRWTFVYVGSNQDIAKVSQALYIPFQNTYSFESNPIGTANAFTVSANSMGSYFGGRKRGLTSSDSYFGGIVPSTTTSAMPPVNETVIINNANATVVDSGNIVIETPKTP